MIEIENIKDCGSNVGIYNISISNAIMVSENATNGDVIKAIFPNAQITRENDTYIYVENIDSHLPLEIFKCWWNAPYKIN